MNMMADFPSSSSSSYSGIGVAVVVLLLSVSIAVADTVIQEDVIDGRPCVVLENSLVRAVFFPSQGGQCTDLVYKPTGKRLIDRMEGALLGSRVWNYADAALYMQWQNAAWDYTIERRPGEVGLVLSAMGKVDFTKACRFDKHVALRDGESQLRVTHSFHVGAQLMTPRKIGLWFRNKISVPGERTSYYLPLATGVMAAEFGAGTATGWFYDPSRGWLALAGESGVGLAFNMEYKRLMCFYGHAGAPPTIEWAFRTIDIKAGDTFSTDQRIVLFNGIRHVHGSADGVVAGFEAPDKVAPGEAAAGLSLKALLTAGAARSGLLRVTVRRLPDGEAATVCETPVSLKPGEVTPAAFTARAAQPGTWMLSGVLLQEGTPVMDFAKPITVGESGTAVRIAPLEKRLGRATEHFKNRKPLAGSVVKDLPYTTEIETPHVKWARPLAGGKLRVLVLTSCLNGREAAELAQRLDMEIVWVTAGAGFELRRLGRLFGASYGTKHMNQGIKEALAKPLDAVIVGALNASVFSEDVLDALMKKVSDGAGLVYVAPIKGPDKLYDFLPVKKETHPRFKNGRCRPVKPHFITGGVPFDVLPPTDYVVYGAGDEVLADANVVATISSGPRERAYPLIAAQEGPGKGRVVVFSYNTGWQGSGGYMSGMTPWRKDRDTDVSYWEYDLAVLAKALVWSARREPAARLVAGEGRVVSGRPEIVTTFRNTGGAAELKADITLRDAYGRIEWQNGQKVSIGPGESTLRLPLPAETGGGLHVADMIFRDAEGNSVAWGAASVIVKGRVLIDSVTADKQAYRGGDTVRATVKLRPAEGGGGDVLLTATLTDDLGRLLGRRQWSVAVDGETETAAELKLGEPLTTTAAVRIEAATDGRVSAVMERQILILPRRFVERRWGDDWPVAVWGSAGGSYGRKYLAAALARRFKDFGISVCLAGSRWLNEREYRDQVRSGFQVMPMGVAFGCINLNESGKGRMSFKEQLAEYNKTHDKKHLVRPVCLNDPGDLEPLSEKLRELARYAAWVEPIGYNLGDEVSVTDHVTPLDYDFGPAALTAFRDWLKTQYASPAALNRQWGTDFKTWDAVMPMTAHEVKGRGNYSPWADHRAFMDVTLANFLKWTRDQLRREDPKATVGLSGTQAAEAYGGYNWPLLASALDFAQTYTTGDQLHMHRSFGSSMHRLTWQGYGARNPRVRIGLWHLLFQGNHGMSYYSSDAMLNPDFTFSPTAADMAPVIREFQSGLARLLGIARRTSLIGMHYSHASIRGAYITGATWRFSQNRSGWIHAMDALGYQCELVSAAGIEAGELRKRAYPAFILPYSVAVSDKEAAELTRYVKSGGLLIADGKTGLMDEHCATRERGALDDLLGVTRPAANPLTPLREGTARFTRDMGACRLSEISFDDNAADPDLELAGGEALGSLADAPVFVVRALDKGRTVLTNFLLNNFKRRLALGAEAPLVEVVRNALALKGVQPAVAVRAEGSPTPRLASTVCYASGDAVLAGTILVPGDQGADWSAKVIFSFPKEGYIYDLREGKFVVRGRSAGKRVAGGDAALYALMPYRTTRVDVDVERSTLGAGDTVCYSVRMKANGGKPGPGVYRVEVVGPDGQPRTHYGVTLTARAGRAEGGFETALNDMPGTWTVKAADYVSRVTGKATFDIGK